MYSTCLFCNADLGKNEVIEHFPVGRRLAFDASKGRLWVVCRKCERWNLTPLEERWEAIEECEREFTATRRRVSTDNIGMARLPEGLELVRIGAPQRPEMAAWRYGDQFGRRRKRHVAMIAGAAVLGGAVVVAGPVAGIIGTGALSPLVNVLNIANVAYRQRKRVRIPLADGGSIETNMLLASQARLIAGQPEAGLLIKLPPPGGRMGWRGVNDGTPVTLHGEDAIRAAGAILPLVNQAGGGRQQVADAVKAIEDTPSASALFRQAAVEAKKRFDAAAFQWGDPGGLRKLPLSMRLALEMAAHEEQERRALEGELAELEAAWKQAEEIAAIADDLLVGDGVRGALARIRRRRDG
jgi:hypothetical protein